MNLDSNLFSKSLSPPCPHIPPRTSPPEHLDHNVIYAERTRNPTCVPRRAHPQSASRSTVGARQGVVKVAPTLQAPVLSIHQPLKKFFLCQKLHHTPHPQARPCSQCSLRKSPGVRRSPKRTTRTSGPWHSTRSDISSPPHDHTTRFWARERPGDAASIFAPGGAKLDATAPSTTHTEYRTSTTTRSSCPALASTRPCDCM